MCYMLKKWIYILTTYQNKIEIITKTNIYFNDFKLKRMSLSWVVTNWGVSGHFVVLRNFGQYTHIVNYWQTRLQLFNKHWSISFFSPFDMHQSHHLLEWQATDSSSSLTIFLCSLRFSNSLCLTKKLTTEKIKTIC